MANQNKNSATVLLPQVRCLTHEATSTFRPRPPGG
jgi:hypothetical protein